VQNLGNFRERLCPIGVAHAPEELGLPMNAEEYRRRARRCLVVARQTACPHERARTIDTAMLWVELAEWAEGNWPPGQEPQTVRPDKSDDAADGVEEFRFDSEGRDEPNRIKS
jgi:hypothetical protein